MDLDGMLAQPSYQLFRAAFAERKAPLVIICGSGLSAPAGIPTWPGLKKKLLSDAEAKERVVNQIGKTILSPQIEGVKNNNNMWVSFKILKQILTRPIFDNLVERYLTPDDSQGIPKGYLELARLNPRGVVTLNIDKFAGESFAGMPSSNTIYGKELAQRWNLLNVASSYLVYLHGGIHDPSTWVFTQDDLEEISKTEGYKLFLGSLFTQNLVLFAGVSADDIALSDRLMNLTDGGFRPKNLYWLTNRVDAETEGWADKAYVSLIRYQASTNDDHNKAMKFFVDDCASYISKDLPEPPLENTSIAEKYSEGYDQDVDPDDLAQMDPEQIRIRISSILNRNLSEADSPDQLFSVYRNFCEKYDYAVHRAFYRGRQDRFRTWFGYKLDSLPIGRGNFGEVYSAKNAAGELVAVKIMHESIFGNDDMLGGFRRGVRSMRFVTEQQVSGMVPILDNFELPPTIVMPYIGGLSLQDALQAAPNMSWPVKIDIALGIGRIVMSGHALPQTVLHRDLKPSNIMVSNMEFDGAFEPNIIVLDFDMSWHKGSKEKDVVFESRDDFGYLSPEQTDPSNKYAARSTRVDSYGFGMTLFYIFGLESPRPNEALSDYWIDRATRAAGRGYKESWLSAPARLGRLIVRATQIDQNERVDFATMVHEIGFLRQAVVDRSEMYNPDMWAEELLAIVSAGTKYTWDDAVARGRLETLGGVTISTAGNFRNDNVALEIRYIEAGMRERGSLGKYLGSAIDQAQKVLSEGHWQIRERRVGTGEAMIAAVCPIEALRNTSEEHFALAKKAVEAFFF